ncbi:D-glycero-beta-D-manno-heptose-1,7-bisphosphate 7-phosphatase [Phycisphaerales bacterium]|nr:D-glycero-beta-D-manno-heptose-1,7-bisphosphate 7-phosphatase [Phycisphaerales bacterium]
MTPAVFLDRDDTLIECTTLPAPPPPAKAGDLVDPRLVRLLPGVADGLARLHAAGFRLVVVSNQGVVARGGATLEQVEAVNQRLREVILTEAGVDLAGVYFCPFHPAGTVPRFHREHSWRKPAPGMILAAASELEIDLSASWLIGDAARDVDAGTAAGIARERCLQVGEGRDVPEFAAAADVVLAAHDIGAIVAEGGEVVTVLMHAADAGALCDARVRSTVIAAARAIGERAGLIVLHAAIEGDALIVTLGGSRLTGLGLLAEVRRATERWHRGRTGNGLWRGNDE